MDPKQPSYKSPSSMGTDQPSGQSRPKSFTEQANEAVRKVGETAQQAQGQAKGTIETLSSQATGTAKHLLNSQVNAGADFAGSLAHSIHCAADDLDQSAPQLGELAREAARRVDAFAGRVREKNVEELFEDASEFARRQPAVVFGAAAVLGFALFRMLKVGTQTASGVSDHGRFASDSGQWRQPETEAWKNQQFGAAR